MNQKICIALIVFVSNSGLFAAHNSLKVKNKTNQEIEFKLHAGASQGKNIEAGKSAHFSVKMSDLEGVDWKIPSKSKAKCSDWYVLNKKSPLVTSLRTQGKDSVLIIEEEGGFQSVTGKSIQKVDRMTPFSDVCHK
jgi:hypothetical protein